MESPCKYCDPDINFSDIEKLTDMNEDIMCNSCLFTKQICKELFFEILDRGLIKI